MMTNIVSLLVLHKFEMISYVYDFRLVRTYLVSFRSFVVFVPFLLFCPGQFLVRFTQIGFLPLWALI